ncbi:NUDIX domain-containing protein [Haloactinomyces albus]|uniref:8-oxo-dGTP diphosphatase n=1 Tax=Haloactinomyces albus TaxID=1352928 RepID=A0AAE3ZH34_9ACTN|nr:NUDIX domain-containing protein [Haloactinomyces albus]MDR7302804.1 8-oxo-dGTP diphosphatase [Haloactinomyces albus]
MATVRSTGWIDAPVNTVGAALRHTRTAERGLGASRVVRGRAAAGTGELFVPGDEITFRLPPAGLSVGMRMRLERADAQALSSVLVQGPLRQLRHESMLAGTNRRTLVTESLEWTAPFGAFGRLVATAVLRRWILGMLAQRIGTVRALAQEWARRPVVVGTAIVHRGRLLAQQRHYPARHAGRWELPGGRVEPGESEHDAVVRECKEELDLEVVPTGRVGTDVPIGGEPSAAGVSAGGMLLRLYTAEPAEPSPAPRAVEHRALRWVDASELARLDWLETDRLLVHSLRRLLHRH